MVVVVVPGVPVVFGHRGHDRQRDNAGMRRAVYQMAPRRPPG
jgi:hypothetical protein